jgi:thiamine pyrophosphokinase
VTGLAEPGNVGHTLVIADGAVPQLDALDAAWPGWSEGIDRVIAADGGARHAARLGLTVDLWVGDGDSLDDAHVASLEAAGVPIRRARTDKDETDAELALLAALERGPARITVLGALGGERLDH